MKKIFIICGFLLMYIVIFNSTPIKAYDSNYKGFEDIYIEEGAKFLSEYDKTELKKYYKYVNKKKFTGNRVYYLNQRKKVTYRTETIFSYYNDGTTPIDYSVERKDTNINKTSFTVSGGLKLNVKNLGKAKNGSLESKLESEYSNVTTSESSTVWKLNVKVDPGTMLNLYIDGEGYISNGVAATYIFWITQMKGGFEIFVVTTQYYRLEKVRIR